MRKPMNLTGRQKTGLGMVPPAAATSLSASLDLRFLVFKVGMNAFILTVLKENVSNLPGWVGKQPRKQGASLWPWLYPLRAPPNFTPHPGGASHCPRVAENCRRHTNTQC